MDVGREGGWNWLAQVKGCVESMASKRSPQKKIYAGSRLSTVKGGHSLAQKVQTG